MLLNLPPEALIIIFNHVVFCAGIRSSIRLRIICRSINDYILDAIYTLSTFGSLDDDSPEHLAWDAKMGTSFVAGLIRRKLRKLRTNHQECVLVRQILLTSNFLTQSLIDINEETYTDALVRLVADTLPLHEIIDGLSWNPRTSRNPDATHCLLENSLAVVLYLDQTSHAQALLSLGAKAQCRTKWFGDAFLIAARYATTETFWAILRTALATNDPTQERLTAARLVTALEHAAAHNKAGVFSRDLWPFVEQTYDQRQAYQVFEPAIQSATLMDHEQVVLAIFDLLKCHNNESLNTMPNDFWREILRLAASNGSECILQTVLSNTAIADVPGSLNLPLEDACRSGRAPVVKLLLAHHTERNLDSWSGSFFWTARRADYGILSTLVHALKRTDVTYLGDVLCGASTQGDSAMAAVFEIVATWCPMGKGLKLDGKTYAQVMDMIFEAGVLGDPLTDHGLLEVRYGSPSALEDDILQDLLSEEHRRLAQACREGSFVAVCDIVTRFGDGEMGESHYSAGGFSESITQQHPGMLQYLCEKFPWSRHFTVEAALDVRSTAIFQILLDHSWAIDAAPSRLKPPILGNMSQSAEMTRWFLAHGSNPNQRCDWDITPFSAAVKNASLSTIRLMFEHGADTRKGQLLHFAIERNLPDQLAVIDLLICFGASPDARMFEDDPDSWLENRFFGMGTPLHTAVARGNLDATAHLIWRGASCHILDTLGRRALDIARGESHLGIVKLIESL